MPSEYIPRVVDRELLERLEASGGVLIEGPRSVGKTQTARRLAASEALLDVDDRLRLASGIEPQLVLDGEPPRLIDEWQIEPKIWNHIRRAIDDRGEAGQFILTGSATPADDLTRHSGAGRISRMRMRPMSLLESDRSSGEISLQELLDGEPARTPGRESNLEELATEIVTGGWPGLRQVSARTKGRAMRDYLSEITHVDLEHPDLPRHDAARVDRLIASLARNVSTEASAATLAKDTGGDDEAPLSDDSVRAYLEALRRIFILEDQPAWGPHLRSRYRTRTSPKLHLADPSLAAAGLRASAESLLKDLRLLGLLFESLVVRDLRVYAQACDAKVLHYRDESGLEADLIIEHADGRWAAFEVKLGGGLIDEAAISLKKLAARVDTEVCGEPAALGVIVPHGLGMQREDGVQIVPLNALGP